MDRTLLIERLNARQLRQRARSRRMRHGRKNIVVRGGKIRRITAKERRARIKAAMRLRKLAKRPTIRRKAMKSRKIYARLLGRARPRHESQHSFEFVHAVNEFAALTGQVALAVRLLEDVDTDLTSTPIGVYTLDVCEKLETNTTIGRSFLDAIVISEDTSIFCFEKADTLNEASLQRALAEFGEALVLCKPGDAINEDEVSDLYLVALTPDPSRLKGMVVEHTDESVGEIDIVEEEQEITKIATDPVFTELSGLIAA